MIGVAVFRRKQMPPPVSMSPSRREAASDAAGAQRAQEAEARLGTGHGRRESSLAQYAAFERASSAPAETVMLYYDSYQNLLARGIVRESAPIATLPRAFPGFVADPQR